MKYNNYPVKVFTTMFVVCAGLFVSKTNAQAVLNGGVLSGFGVDADVESDTVRHGNATSLSNKGLNTDDWFKFKSNGTGIGIIDTTGTHARKVKMSGSSAGLNGSAFTSSMSVPLLTVSNGYTLLDALFGKDYYSSNDTTIFSSGTTIDGPSSWSLKTGSVPQKSDIIDFGSHLRRQGDEVTDSLWMYLWMTFQATNGNKEGAVELFVNDIVYDKSSNSFTGSGTAEGRVPWKFNNLGQVTQVGDFTVSFAYSGSTFTIDPRIWVADSLRNNSSGSYKTPVNFDWGTDWDKKTNYGFQSIKPKSGKSFGWGLSNSTAMKAPPHGTVNASGVYSTTYSANQVVEVGINFTELGVDPANFTLINSDPCAASYRTIVYRTRSSSSFTSNLQDFAGPFPFWRNPTFGNEGLGDTLTCSTTSVQLSVVNPNNLAYYKWVPMPGDPTAAIDSYNGDSSIITVSKAGKYVLSSATLAGCTTYKDTVTILQDTTKPVAQVIILDTLITGSVSAVQIVGGNTTQSINRMNTNSSTFGPHKAFIWSWSGPAGFTSPVQSPYPVTVAGQYNLTLTETRNGCTSSASGILVLLPVEFGKFRCGKTPEGVQLNWETYQESNASAFNIERWNGNTYQTIGTVQAKGNSSTLTNYVFVDKAPKMGANIYRVALHSANAEPMYSEPCVTNITGQNTNLPFVFNVFPNPGQGEFTVTSALNASTSGTVFLYDLSGRVITSEVLNFDETGAAKINLGHVSSGIYMLGMVNDDMPQTVKVVIK